MADFTEERILDDILTGYKEQMTQSLLKVLSFKSILDESAPGAPFGKRIGDALEYALNLSSGLGLTSENYDGYVGIIDLGENKDPNQMIGILTHIDIVPLGEGWTHDPLGELEDGVIYGRGTEDDKGPIIAVIYAMKALKESGLPLSKTIRHIIGTDEESGFRGITKYLERNQPPGQGFTPDAAFPLIYAEKGLAHFILAKEFNQEQISALLEVKGGSASNIVPDRAEARVDSNIYSSEQCRSILKEVGQGESITIENVENTLLIKAKGKCAHASMPGEGKNAISLLLKVLRKLSLPRDERADFINDIYQLAGKDIDGSGLGVKSGDEISELTMSLTTIRINDSRGEAGIDVRFPIKSNSLQLKEKIMATASSYGLEVDGWKAKEPLFVPVDNPLVQKLLEVYRDVTGDDLSAPLAIGGGTYARVMKDFVAFGPNLPSGPTLAHQAEEKISEEHLLLLSRIYAHAIYRLAK